MTDSNTVPEGTTLRSVADLFRSRNAGAFKLTFDFVIPDDDLYQDNFYLDDEESTIVTLRRYSSSSSREDNAIISQDNSPGEQLNPSPFQLSPGEQLNPSPFQLTTADHATFRRFSTTGDDQQQEQGAKIYF